MVLSSDSGIVNRRTCRAVPYLWDSMKRIGPFILTVLAFTLVIVVSAPLRADNGNGNGKGKKADPTGTYTATVAGYFKGEGTASASGNRITITADITDESGSKGKLTTNDLTVDNTNHFTGTGSALGYSLKFSGRVDADGQDSAIKTKRFVCTFKTSKDSNGQEHHGRVVGFVDLTSSSVTTRDDSGGGGSGPDPGPGQGDGGTGDENNPPPPGRAGGGGRGGEGHGGRGGNHQPHRGGDRPGR
jgi:hypothetical protein